MVAYHETHAARLIRYRRVRPTRAAAGLSATIERQRAAGTRRGDGTHDAVRLAVHGTCDPLASTMRSIAKGKCPCCAGTGRAGYELSDKGRRRLRVLRAARAEA